LSFANSSVCRELGLAAAWARVVGMAGAYEGMGEPVVHQAGDYTVVKLAGTGLPGVAVFGIRVFAGGRDFGGWERHSSQP
jgi:hypothetical protein